MGIMARGHKKLSVLVTESPGCPMPNHICNFNLMSCYRHDSRHIQPPSVLLYNITFTISDTNDTKKISFGACVFN